MFKRFDDNQKNKVGLISIENSPEFCHIYEAINACTGRNLKGYQQATYPLNSCYRLWFPKLPIRKNGQLIPWSTEKSWVNELSDDGLSLRAHSETDVWDKLEQWDCILITFAKAGPQEPYRYIGTFKADKKQSKLNDIRYVRVANRIDISGIDLK